MDKQEKRLRAWMAKNPALSRRQCQEQMKARAAELHGRYPQKVSRPPFTAGQLMEALEELASLDDGSLTTGSIETSVTSLVRLDVKRAEPLSMVSDESVTWDVDARRCRLAVTVSLPPYERGGFETAVGWASWFGAKHRCLVLVEAEHGDELELIVEVPRKPRSVEAIVTQLIESGFHAGFPTDPVRVRVERSFDGVAKVTARVWFRGRELKSVVVPPVDPKGHSRHHGLLVDELLHQAYAIDADGQRSEEAQSGPRRLPGYIRSVSDRGAAEMLALRAEHQALGLTWVLRIKISDRDHELVLAAEDESHWPRRPLARLKSPTRRTPEEHRQLLRQLDELTREPDETKRGHDLDVDDILRPK
jgi:hypothetical protein